MIQKYKKILQTSAISLLLMSPLLLGVFFSATVLAEEIPAGCPDSQLAGPPAPGVCEAIPAGCPGSLQLGPPAPSVECPYTLPEPSDSIGDSDGALSGDCSEEVLNSENCGIIGLLVMAINILSALAGMAIIASIVVAGYQYMTARDNSGQIQKARMRIIWALSALALFVFMYAILNFLIPGGLGI